MHKNYKEKNYWSALIDDGKRLEILVKEMQKIQEDIRRI